MKTLLLLLLTFITLTSCERSDKYKAQIISTGERFWVDTDYLYAIGDTIQVYRDNYYWSISTYWDNDISDENNSFNREIAIIIDYDLY